jgi:hypothetical protein
MENGAEKAG